MLSAVAMNHSTYIEKCLQDRLRIDDQCDLILGRASPLLVGWVKLALIRANYMLAIEQDVEEAFDALP